MKRWLLICAACAIACVPVVRPTPGPVTPPTPVSTFALTVVVTDAGTGRPVRAEVYTDSATSPWRQRTNTAGFARKDGFTAPGWNLCAAADSYETHCEPVGEARSRVIVFSLHGTGPRAGRLPLGASFATHNDRQGVPVFDPFWSGLPAERRGTWLEDKRARRLTHILLSRKWNYDRYTAQTGFAGGFITTAEFNARIEEAYRGGLWPLVWLPFDDDAAGQASVYDGRMEAELRSLLPVIDKIAAVSPMWEAPGAWTAKAIADAGALSRRILGPNVLLILHGRDNERFTGASYKGIIEVGEPVPTGLSGRVFFDEDEGRNRVYLTEADDPSGGDEIGWWFVAGADQYDIFAWESRHGPDGPTYSDGVLDPNSGTWLGRFLEGWERFAPAGTFMPALGRAVRTNCGPRCPPDWFSRGRARGRPMLSPFELQEYEDVLDVVPDSRIDHVANLLAGLGVTHFGSGIPTEVTR